MSEAEMAKMMELWMKAITPGEGHVFLEQLVGSWDMKTTVWMEGPESTPTVSTGTAETRWILDGHYVEMMSEGTMMGRPHRGRAVTGYDNFRKKYVGTWIDNMSTAIYTMEGFLDRTGTELSMYGAADDVTTGEHDKPVRYVTRVIDTDHHVFEMYDLDGGIDFKVMEIEYTRQQ